MRSDAHDNRERLLDAARELFADEGLGVTMRQVARRAGVGPATLYRRFPTRQALVDAAFADELRACREVVDDACADPDPWRGFEAAVTDLAVLNARNQGFVDAFTAGSRATGSLAEHRVRLQRQLAGLMARARAAGDLRPDADVADLVLVLLGVRGLSPVPADQREAAARRLAALAVDGFRTRRAPAAAGRGRSRAGGTPAARRPTNGLPSAVPS